MPPRKPRALKLLTGTLRPGREPAVPARPRPGKARPPKCLSAPQRAAFQQLAAQVEATGTPTRSFPLAIAATAILWSEIEQCNAALATTGATFETKTTSGAPKLALRPEAEMRMAALRLLRAYLAELGLTPGSVGRVDRAAMPESPDAFERFFG